MPSKPATPLPPLLAGLPLDIPFIKQAGKNVVLGQQFDVSMTGVDEFLSSSQMWFGRVWCCVPDARPLSTSGPNPSPPSSPVNYASGLERILQTLFTKFANKEFAEGLFLIRAEMGADWCTVSDIVWF